MTERQKRTGGSGEAAVDVLIAGGGMVGASLAVALASSRLRTMLVEAVPFGDAGQPSFDSRTVALSRSSQRILSGLGIWLAVVDSAHAIRRIHVSERGRFGTALIDAAQQGVEALGYVVDNRCLGAALWQALNTDGGATIASPARVLGASAEGDGLRVVIAAGERRFDVRTRLLVVADGARSALRGALGIAARTRPYGQTAIVGNVGVSRPERDTAYERFTPAGPLALLPAGGDRYAFVLTRRTADAEPALALPDEEFLGLLQKEFGYRLGRLQQLGKRIAYPLELVRAERVTAARVAVIGNAAHGLHPVAGQGYNLGLRDVAALAELLTEDRGATVCDPGAPELLRRYADWRARDQRNVVAFTDGLIRLFELAPPPLGTLRGAGLLAFDLLPPVKRALARHTMGLAGRQTRLARGKRL